LGIALQIVLSFAIASLLALSSVVTLAVEMLKEGESPDDAEPGNEGWLTDTLSLDPPNPVHSARAPHSALS
jgi:hypothetical protein